MFYFWAPDLVAIGGEPEADADAREAFRRETDELVESQREVPDALDE